MGKPSDYKDGDVLLVDSGNIPILLISGNSAMDDADELKGLVRIYDRGEVYATWIEYDEPHAPEDVAIAMRQEYALWRLANG